MLVVAIITLLIGLLIPVTNGVRKQAKITQCRAILQALDTGIATFQADSKFGGQLPPSRSDSVNDSQRNGDRMVASPHENTYSQGNAIKDPPQGSEPRRRGLSGAALLYWALVGADGLGAPGFKDLNGDGFWYNDTYDGQGNENRPGAYDKDQQTGKPLRPRAELYVNKDKAPASPVFNDSPNAPEEEREKYRLDAARDKDHKEIGMPVFLDAYKQPVLYYRANKTQTNAVNLDPTYKNKDLIGVYDPYDNSYYTGLETLPAGQAPTEPDKAIDLGAVLPPGQDGFIHPLSQLGSMQNVNKLGQNFEENTFQGFIRDKNVTVRVWPHNPDSYLLISAGPDHMYGTEDDITNFR